MRILSLVVIAACASGRGVDIEIRSPDATIDHVELFLAPDDCKPDASGAPCPSGIVWAAAQTAPPPGKIFMLASDDMVAADVTGGVVRYRLEATAARAALARIAIVGFAAGQVVAAEVLTNVTIPTDHAEVWQVDLVAAGDVLDAADLPPRQGTSDKRAHVWTSAKRPATLSDCAVVQHWNGTAWTREYYAPPSDPDCDGEMIECDPYWFDYGATRSVATCLTTEGPADSGACTTGTSLCADGVSSNDNCNQDGNGAETCVPSMYCSACSTEPSLDATCFEMQTQAAFTNVQASTIPIAECRFPVDMTNNNQPCPAQAPLPLTVPAYKGSCPTAELRMRTPAPLGPVVSAAQIGMATIMYQPHTGGGTDCLLEFSWSGMATLLEGEVFMLDLSYGTKHIAFPIRLAFEQPTVCTTLGRICKQSGPTNDSMLSCLQ